MVKYILVCFILYQTILISKSIPHPGNVREKRGNSPENPEKCDSPIIFPDMDKCNFTAKGKGKNCVAGICEDADDYPYNHVNKIQNQLSGFGNLFGFSEGTVIEFPSRGSDGKLEPELENLCSTSIVTKYPKTLKTATKVEKYIVNVEGYKQGVIFEMCSEPKGKCKFSDTFPNGFTSECTQKFVTRRLVALGEDGNPGYDSFIVPSCCICSTRHIN